jgi:hypothetical protein
MKKELQEEGKGGGNELQKLIDEMNKTEIDLVNKRLDNEMLKRQKDILTRLLEAENADRQRKLDDKRKSRTADQVEKKHSSSLRRIPKKEGNGVGFIQNCLPFIEPFL